LKQRIKVNGKAGQLGNQVSVTRSGTTIKVQAQAPFSKRYVKYLTKKFLKQQQLRDWIRVVSSNKSTYTLKYFNIQDEEGEEGAEK
jgi:large subunit ribosomal protein L22e